MNYRKKLLAFGALIAALAALWHLLCILGGPSWYRFARAPREIIESAELGTWLAPLGTILVAGLMFTCSLYAASVLGVIKKLPLEKTAVATIALLCLLRGVVVIPLWLSNTAIIDAFMIVSSAVWFFVGVCFAVGLRESFQEKHEMKHRL